MADNQPVNMGEYGNSGEFPATPTQPAPPALAPSGNPQFQNPPPMQGQPPAPEAPAKPSPQQDIPFGGRPIPESTEGTEATKAGLTSKGIQPTYWDTFWTTAKQGLFDSSPTSALLRGADRYYQGSQDQSAGIPQISAAEANRRFPGLPKPFTESVYPAVAQTMSDNYERSQMYQAWSSRGPDLGVLGSLGASAVGGADPINLLLGFGIGAATGGLGLAGRLGGGFLAKSAVLYGENLAANLAGGVPALIENKAEHQGSPDAASYIAEAAAGAAVGTGIHLTIAGLFAKARASIQDIPESTVRDNIKSAAAQHETGSTIEMGPAQRLQQARDVGQVAGVSPQGIDSIPRAESHYTFTPVDDPHTVNYHVALNPDSPNLTQMALEHGAVVGTTSVDRANNIAAVPESAHEGQIIRAKLAPDASVVKGETPFIDVVSGENKGAYHGFNSPERVDAAMEKIKGILGDDRKFKDYEPIFRTALESHASVGDVYDAFMQLPQNRITVDNKYHVNDFNKIMDGLGHDGVTSVVYHAGEPIDNQVHMWNADKLEPQEIIPGDRSRVPTHLDMGASSLHTQDTENGRFHDEAANRRIEQAAHTADPKIEPEASTEPTEIKPSGKEETETKVDRINTDADQREQEVRASLDALASEPGSEHIADAVKDIDADFRREQAQIEAGSKMIDCMAENMV